MPLWQRIINRGRLRLHYIIIILFFFFFCRLKEERKKKFDEEQRRTVAAIQLKLAAFDQAKELKKQENEKKDLQLQLEQLNELQKSYDDPGTASTKLSISYSIYHETYALYIS